MIKKTKNYDSILTSHEIYSWFWFNKKPINYIHPDEYRDIIDKIKGGCTINADHDHRIAMAFNILGLVSEKPIKVLGNKSISSSFPNFFELINLLSQKND